MIPVVRAQRPTRVPEPPRPRNPLMTRVCVLVGSMLLLVPVALSLRADNEHVRAAEVKAADTVFVGTMPPAPTQAAAAADTAAPTTLAPTTLATLAPTTPPPTEGAAATPAPTAAPTNPPTTAKVVQKAAPKPTTTPAPPPSAATQAATQTSCTQTYTIVSGDAWSTIASRAKVSMSSLLAANGATIQTLLLPGKKICLPDGAVTPAAPAPKVTTTTKPPSTTQPATTQPKTTTPTTQPPTPAVTTVPASTQPPPPANTYSKAEVAQIIRDVWPDNLEDEAIRIATRESGLVPTVRNYCCYGLFQIYYTAHKTWLANMGITTAAQLYDPRVNATAALALYNSNGWAPWATATTVLV